MGARVAMRQWQGGWHVKAIPVLGGLCARLRDLPSGRRTAAGRAAEVGTGLTTWGVTGGGCGRLLLAQ